TKNLPFVKDVPICISI
ncbi:Hypothetical protein SRAE_0000074300, partial [Strongyloides ratti]